MSHSIEIDDTRAAQLREIVMKFFELWRSQWVVVALSVGHRRSLALSLYIRSSTPGPSTPPRRFTLECTSFVPSSRLSVRGHNSPKYFGGGHLAGMLCCLFSVIYSCM
jgi:hypothetical protein